MSQRPCHATRTHARAQDTGGTHNIRRQQLHIYDPPRGPTHFVVLTTLRAARHITQCAARGQGGQRAAD